MGYTSNCILHTKGLAKRYYIYYSIDRPNHKGVLEKNKVKKHQSSFH
jgi:hypothetical protein